MKIDLSKDDPTIDAVDLAKSLGQSAEQVMELMRNGGITSRFETGVGDDSGTHRLTFWYKDLRVRYICDDSGTVLKTSRVKAAPRS